MIAAATKEARNLTASTTSTAIGPPPQADTNAVPGQPLGVSEVLLRHGRACEDGAIRANVGC
jgi:hypothetical protein